jgi:hypothetical protein
MVVDTVLVVERGYLEDPIDPDEFNLQGIPRYELLDTFTSFTYKNSGTWVSREWD